MKPLLFACLLPALAVSSLAAQPEVEARLDGRPLELHQFAQGWFGVFEVGRPRAVEVRTAFDVRWVDVRPRAAGVSAEVEGDHRTIRLRMTEPLPLTVEFNDDLARVLHLFAYAPEKDPPRAQAKGVRYFGPGVHAAGTIELKDGETLYLAPGAWVKGAVRSVGTKEVSICGRGVLDGSEIVPHDADRAGNYGMGLANLVYLDRTVNARVEGITLFDSRNWTVVVRRSSGTRVAGVRILNPSEHYGDDGIDLVSSSGVTVEDCFVRTNDDCVVVKNLDDAPTHDIAVRRCVLWNMPSGGNGLEIGFETSHSRIANVRFSDIDLIHVQRGSAISIHNADAGDVEDISYDRIRVEDVRRKLVDFGILYSQNSLDRPAAAAVRRQRLDIGGVWDGAERFTPAERAGVAAGRGHIRHIRVDDFAVEEGALPYSLVAGFDAQHAVEDVVVSGLSYQGRPILSAQEGKFVVEDAPGFQIRGGAVSAAQGGADWRPLGPPRFHAGEVHTDQVISFDDSDWTAGLTGAVPGPLTWVSWHFRPGPELRGKDLLLRVGREHPSNITYCNGAAVAGGLGEDGQAEFLVPGLLAHAGADNVIAVRVTDAAGWAALREGGFGWTTLASEAPRYAALARRASAALEAKFASLGPRGADFVLRGLRSRDIERLLEAGSSDRAWKIAESWRRLRELSSDSARRLREAQDFARGEPLEFMRGSEAYLVPDFSGDAVQRPAMGSEFSDFGSWYDVAYSGGVNRFYIGSVRQGVGPDHEFFNTARDVAQVALYVRTSSGQVIDGDGGQSSVAWYPYGWRTATRPAGFDIESRAFFTGFNTLAVYGRVANHSGAEARIAPGLFLTSKSNYDGQTGGRLTGSAARGGRMLFRAVRSGLNTQPELYGDTLAVGSTLPGCEAVFADRPCPSARGAALQDALGAMPGRVLDAPSGSARLQGAFLTLRPGASIEFVYVIAAAARDSEAAAACDAALQKWQPAPRAAVTQVETDWSGFLGGLPRLDRPTLAEAKLYYGAAIALRKNRYLYRDEGRLWSASFPARGGFNYFYQSDSCWNLLGYLDFHPAWAEGHAVPILVPPCEIMDPHFFWSMWELYARLPDPAQRRAFAARVYPLLERAYSAWLAQVDTDGDLLVSTPDNWDDNPRYDLFYKEEKYVPGWNSWWNDLVRACSQAPLDDPAPSSQLGYGAVVLGRFARLLGREGEARHWEAQRLKHIAAVDSLWDEKAGYWTVSYRHTQRDDVLTSSIIYPIFADLCRDPARIRRVIETHLLNPAEFDGRFPIPTVAYDSPRYYHQKPPFQDLAGGLWRGNLWMPEAWVIVKGLYKYGYEAEAGRIAAAWLDMMSHEAASTGAHPQFSWSPAEWYDSRTGLAQNNRAFSWSSAVALDLLLGNYQNERVLGANPSRDRSVDGAIREIYAFGDGRSLFRVYPGKTVFPRLVMKAADGEPIDRSGRVEFSFSDPAGNFAGSPIAFTFDRTKWRGVSAATGAPLVPGADGLYRIALNCPVVLQPR